MKKYNIFFGLKYFAWGFCFFTQCTSSSSKDEKIIHVQLAQEIADINRQCPVQLTSLVRLDSCTLSSNNDMVNYYTLNDKIDYTMDDLKILEKEARHQIKTDPNMAQLRSYEVSIRYKYMNSDGNLMLSFEISPNDYN